MLIVCTTQAMAGDLQEVDRECEAWFEREVIIKHTLCNWIFPKTCWKLANELKVEVR